MATIQEIIHKFEVAGGMRRLRIVLPILGLILVILGYNWRGYKNFSTQEAMDSAQLARNISQGRGYTTSFIRPFSVYLLHEHHAGESASDSLLQTNRFDPLAGPHPDLANAPVYPVVLAGLFKVLPLDYSTTSTKPFWSSGGRFYRYQPEFVIAMLNQILLLACAVLVFKLTRRLFDVTVAWMAAVVFLGSEILWRFSVSGLSTLLLMLIFLGLVWCLTLLEEKERDSQRGGGVFALAGLAGLLAGLGGLTRYSFCWIILPVLGFLALYGGRRRWPLLATVGGVFLLVMIPWIARNYSVSGTPFGTAGYAAVETAFPGSHVQQSLQINLAQVNPISVVMLNLRRNLPGIVGAELPQLAGGWALAFFLAGLLVSFNNPALTRLRVFLLQCLIVLSIVEAAGRTYLSDASPGINTENLLVLLLPLFLMFGAGFFFLLLDQMNFAIRELRYAVLVIFGILACLPLVSVFVGPKNIPLSYPPYYPPYLQSAGSAVQPGDLVASDMPWAMAWYGQRDCLWLNSPTDFITVNDEIHPIQALHLTSLSFQAMGKSDLGDFERWIKLDDQSWGSFILQAWQQTLVDYHQDPVRWSRIWPKSVSLKLHQGQSEKLVSLPLHYWWPGWPQQFLLTESPHPAK